MINVLFVCLGNICRSPLAEAIFRDKVGKRGLSHQIACDSAGTSGEHDGEPAYPYSIKVAKEHGLEITHLSRKIQKEDFSKFDYMIAMDKYNLMDIEFFAQKTNNSNRCQLFLMREFDNQKSGKNVEDPWAMGYHKFVECYQILEESCENFLNYLIEKHKLRG